MSVAHLLFNIGYIESALTLLAVFFIFRSKSAKAYWPFLTLLCVHASSVVFLSIWATQAVHYVGAHRTYVVYFYGYWISFGVEAILSVVTIYSIYKAAMAPLQGLQSLGMLVFKWVAAISTAITLGVTLGPKATSMHFIITCVSTMQRGVGILTLSLLLFVCFAIRPMGLSYRSRIFGVSLGLGILSTLNMLQTSWARHSSELNDLFNLVAGLTICATMIVWCYYFAVPEPKRRFILLPTTSPFLRWNQISELLGHNPGYVALGGFAPDTFSPAEMEVMKRASQKMKQSANTATINQAA